MKSSRKSHLEALYVYDPPFIDSHYFQQLSISIPDEHVLTVLTETSILAKKLFLERRIGTRRVGRSYPRYRVEALPMDHRLNYHGNTPDCPRMIELNPARGCQYSCLYCLAIYTEEIANDIIIYGNYHKYVQKLLESHDGSDAVFYLSPQTEALQRALLETGVTHNILRAFVEHYRRLPSSNIRLIMVTKAGQSEIVFQHENEQILDLLVMLGNKVRLIPSIAPLPDEVRDVIEPGAPSWSDRLEMIRTCKQRGLDMTSVIVQPLLEPFLREDVMRGHFRLLSDLGILSAKIEFLTLSYQNMVILFPIIGFFDREAERMLWKNRLECNLKKGGLRIPPEKDYAAHQLLLLRECAREFDICVTLCRWVKDSFGLKDFDHEASKRGFGCMGQRIR